MNVRYGIIFLVVASVFAISHVNSEEANADTMVRREAAAAGLEEMHGESKRSPMDPRAKALIKEIIKRLHHKKGRSAESMNMDRARRNPDPSILDVLTNLVNKAMDATG